MKFVRPNASLIDYLWRHLHQLPAKHDPHDEEVVESDSDHVVEGLLHLVRAGVSLSRFSLESYANFDPTSQ